MNQAVSATFFSSMRVSLNVQNMTSRNPLHIAIASGDVIDVQMILDELGSDATASISSRDHDGRTALHVAALSKSSRIVSLLLESYRVSEGRQLAVDLLSLEEEYKRTLSEVRFLFCKSLRNWGSHTIRVPFIKYPKKCYNDRKGSAY
jgi:ankyrin repeat protein